MRSRTVANRAALALTGLAFLAWGAAVWWGEEKIFTAGLRHLEPAEHRLRLPAPGCRLDSRAVRHAVRTGCVAVPGVVRARCRLTGRGGAMCLSVTLTVQGTAHPDEVMTAVTDGVLAQITPLLAPRRLHIRIRLRVQRPRPHRAL